MYLKNIDGVYATGPGYIQMLRQIKWDTLITTIPLS
jgi:hypothetical protein